MRAMAGTFKERKAVFLLRRREIPWEVSPVLDETQLMLGGVLDNPCTLYENYELCEKCRHMSFHIPT